MRIRLGILCLTLSACSQASHNSPETGRSYLLRDLEGYAIASCLAFQSHPFLKEQGDAWASVIVQRMRAAPEDLTDLIEKTKSQTDRGSKAVTRVEIGNEGASDLELPVLQCAEIIDRPEIRTEINKLLKDLAPLYR